MGETSLESEWAWRPRSALQHLGRTLVQTSQGPLGLRVARCIVGDAVTVWYVLFARMCCSVIGNRILFLFSSGYVVHGRRNRARVFWAVGRSRLLRTKRGTLLGVWVLYATRLCLGLFLGIREKKKASEGLTRGIDSCSKQAPFATLFITAKKEKKMRFDRHLKLSTLEARDCG
ncbi:hypothetical protein VTK73DRAFT_10308 [Phialemonium thermophilum]|uniref:Uncharacterized protein n=1 Tax=Phialemonium thermophilum TaxID=223376 RepID=A0ABR3VX88_9PEZI